MKRRTKWILGLSTGVPILLVAAVAVFLWLSSPNPELDLTTIEMKELPGVGEDTAVGIEPLSGDEADGEAMSETSPVGEWPNPVVKLPPTIDEFDLPIEGTLVLIGADKPFGEEKFEVSLEGEQVLLRSSGKFWFKALIATITLKYDQILQMDSLLRPMSLTSTFDAPLGFGREIQAEFKDGIVTVQSGEDVEQYPADLERALVVGTFSTYAMIPLLYELRGFEGEVSLDTLVFGGPPNQDDENAADGLPQTRIERVEDTGISFGDRELTVAQYRISGDMGTMMLYALGMEMLGLLAEGDEDSLFVYRADYFEDGFTLIEAVSE